MKANWGMQAKGSALGPGSDRASVGKPGSLLASGCHSSDQHSKSQRDPPVDLTEPIGPHGRVQLSGRRSGWEVGVGATGCSPTSSLAGL
jgi:hypothetical protein